MATIQEFILRFKTEGSGAISALKDDIRDLTNSANPLNSSLGNLAGRLPLLATGALAAAGAFAAFGMRAVQLADQLDDISNATGITAGELNNFRTSLIVAGGDTDSFAKFATKLSVAIGESADGNEKYQKSFRDLGVTIRDSNGVIRSSSDIFQDVLAGLANTDPALRQAKAVEILGKEAAKIDWSNVRAGQDIKFDESVAELAKFQTQIDLLKTSIDAGLVRSFGALATAINQGGISSGIGLITESIGNLVAEIFNLPTDYLAKFLNLFGAGITDAKGLGTPLKYFVEEARKEREQYQAEMKAAAEAKKTAEAKLAKRPGPVAVPGGDQGRPSDATLKAIADSQTRIAQSGIEARKQAELAGATEISRIQIAARYDIERATKEINAREKISGPQIAAEVAAKRVEIESKAATDIAAVRERQGQQLRQIEGINAAYRNQLDLQRGAVEFQTALVGKTEEERAVAEALGRSQTDYRAKDLELRLRIEGLGKNELYQAEALKEQRNKLIETRDQEEILLRQSVESLQKALRLDEGRKTVQEQSINYQAQIASLLGREATELDKINTLIAQQPDKYKEVGDQLRANAVIQDQNLQYVKKFNEEQARSLRVADQGIQAGIDFGAEQQKINLEEERATRLRLAANSKQRDAVNEEIDRRLRIIDLGRQQLLGDEKLRNAALNDLEGDASAEQLQSLRDLSNQLGIVYNFETQLSELRLASAQRTAEQQSSFRYGWEESYKQYKEDAEDAAKQGKQYFDTFSSGVEDAFVKFAQTGKLSFKDLANSIIADFARIQAKRLVVGALGGSGGGGFLGSLLPSVFGNQFTPGSNSFVGPMQPSSGGGFFGNLFGGLFGGGRSAGGAVNQNTPYMVGERGPEMFVPGNAGNIIPNTALGGGEVMQNLTTVNYTIQAVDASSFRALVARDPQFIYSVTEKGRRSQPTRSR